MPTIINIHLSEGPQDLVRVAAAPNGVANPCIVYLSRVHRREETWSLGDTKISVIAGFDYVRVAVETSSTEVRSAQGSKSTGVSDAVPQIKQQTMEEAVTSVNGLRA